MYEIDNAQHAQLSQSYKSGASWFYWIAGLSLITSIIAITGGDWRFLISLGTTQVIDGIAEVLSAELGGAPKVFGFILDLILTGIFVLFGVLAHKKSLTVYAIGMAVFLLDALVSLMIQDLIGVVAHVVVLVFMIRGFMAGRELLALEQSMAQAPATSV